MKPLTIQQAADYYRDTGLTRTAIRRAVLSGEIRHVRAGNKYLLTLENIETWLAGEAVTTSPQEAKCGGIRAVRE